MKRTFTFLMSLFLCIGMTMKAQPAIDTSTADAPKYYVIASYDRGGVLTNAGVDQALTHVTLSDAGYWYFEKANDEGGVHIVNKVMDGENKVYVGSELKASTTAAVWYILPNGVNNAGLSVSKTATISSNSCIDAHNYDNGVGTYAPSANDWNGTTWVVSEEKNHVDVVYNFTYGETDKGSEIAKVTTAIGYEFPAVKTSFPFGISATKPAGNIAEADAVDGVVTKTIALEENLPFAYAADYASIENWYCLKLHASQRNYLYYDENLTYLDASKTAVDADNKDAYAWAFIGNPFDGFKVVNKLAGADKVLSSAAEPTGDKEYPTMTITAEVTGNTTWDLTSSTYAENGFYMAYAGTSKRLDKQDSKVCYWIDGADGGSTFMVELLPETLTYTLTDAFGNVYTGSYEGVAGQTEPVLSGVVGCTYENVVWDGTAFTANVVFPFPVSNEQTINATMISSHNGTDLLWRAEETGITAQKGAEADSDNYKWAIYLAWNEGQLTFTIKNLGTGKFIYSESAVDSHAAGVVALADEGSAFTVEANNKFKLATGKYLSINSAGDTDVQILGTCYSHGGTNNKFIPCEYEPAPEVDPNDYTSYIVNADLSTGDAWNTDGTKGISGNMVKVGSGSTFDFSQTITLPAGQYKMTAKAAYRYGADEQAEYDAILGDTETRLVKLYAETEYKNYEVGVLNRWDGASETNYCPGEENGKPFASTVNDLFVPNSSDAVKAWFDNGQYVNELVFNVQEEGEVKIGITRAASAPDAGDYTNIGAWTLTRIGDAEFDLNEEDFDLDAPAYTDVTADYIVNADLASKDGWTVSGLENDGKFDVNLKAVEFYSGWGALERPNGHLTQEVTVPAGTYRFTGKAFFRQAGGPQDNPGKSLGYLVAGDNKVLIKTLGSANGTAGDFTAGANALYADATFDNVLEFKLTEETKLTIGYETTFDEMKSWFIVGAVKLESVQAVPGALVPIFEAQAMEFCQYSSQAMSDLPAVNAKWEALCSTVLEIYGAISDGKKVLDVEVKRVMDEMTAMTAELKAIEDVYAVYNETKWAMFDIQDNSTPNNAEVKAAFDAAVDAASNVSEVATVAELEAKIAEFEAARQAYVLNAVPAEGFTFDYTFLIANPSFETGDLTGWTVRRYSVETDVRTDGAAGVDGRYCFNSWWNGVYLTQDLVDIPDGVYRLTVALFGGDSGNDATAYIVANKDTLGVNLKNGNPYTDFSVETTVIDGKLHFATVGGNDDDTAENPIGTFSQDGYWWYKADNFRLTYTGALPESVLLELKKEAFLARAVKFEEFINNDVDWNLTMINMTHLYPVQDEVLGNADYGVVGLVERIDEVTDMEELDHWIAEMDKVEAMLKDARVAAAEFSKWQGMIMDAVGFVNTYDEEAAMAAMQYLDFNVGYNCTSVEEILTATTGAEQAYKNFVLTATPSEGHVFDMSFLLVNPNFDKNMDGWTCVNAGHNGGAGYNNVGGIAEIALWGAESWEASITQTLNELPNGKYIVKAAWMAASGIEMTFSANEGEASVTGIGDTGGNIDNDGNVVEMGQGFRGWQYVEVEGEVVDGTLTITVNSSSTALRTWSNADAFELYYAGTVPSKVTLDKTEAALEIEEGKTAQLQLTATIEPADVTLKTLTWESDNEEVATVDANGLVTAVGEGQAVITVTAAGGAKAECVVNVSIVDAIDVVNADTETEIYDLSGRRVEKMQKGIYIVNGKKVIVK